MYDSDKGTVVPGDTASGATQYKIVFDGGVATVTAGGSAGGSTDTH